MKNNKTVIILVVVLVLVLIGAGTTITVLLNKQDKEVVDINDSSSPAGYGAIESIGTEVGIITDSDSASSLSKDLNYAIAFTTEYQRDIYVENGVAECYIGNNEENYYNNMYIQISLNNDDGSLGDEYYLSKIIPRGTHIESFTPEIDLEPGDYTATLIHACIDDEGTLVNNTPVMVEIHVR